MLVKKYISHFTQSVSTEREKWCPLPWGMCKFISYIKSNKSLDKSLKKYLPLQQWKYIYQTFKKFLNTTRTWQLQPLLSFVLYCRFSIQPLWTYADSLPTKYDLILRILWMLTQRYHWWKIKCLVLPGCLTLPQVTLLFKGKHKVCKCREQCRLFWSADIPYWLVNIIRGRFCWTWKFTW